MKIWLTLHKNHKIIADTVCDAATASKKKALESALDQGCEFFELSRPIILKKHIDDMNSFSRTRFFCTDFINEDGFDSLELEIIDGKKKKDK